MGLVRSYVVAFCLAFATGCFAQWGDFGGFGGGGFGGFGGDQNGGGSAEYSEKFADVNYAGDGKEFHNLDIYLPKEVKDSYPVVIHTYGSAWSMNNSKGSADINTICAGFLKAGFAVVTPNHRSASDAIYPAALHDIKAVVRFVRGNAAKYKFDTNFVAVSGFSSGGHLSSLTATTCGMKEGKSGSVTVDLEGSLGEFTSFSSCVDAACLWSPPTDIYTMNPINSFGGSGTFEGAFIGVEREGNKDKWMVASSPYYASEDDPPIIMFHGTSDQVVNIEQSQELYDSLQNHKVVSEFVKVSGGTHGGNEMYVAANLDKAVDFFNKAIEAKAAKVPAKDTSETSIKDTTTTPVDTLVPVDTTKAPIDTIKPPEIIKNVAGNSFGIEVVGNTLNILAGNSLYYKYKVISVNGTFTETGDVLGTLDLSRLQAGVYCVIVSATNGKRGIVRFVKK
ncbi:MAG: alpha/beta hydrolase [Fibrobacter sp.]|nr:alpha/beta hydrolase [Fibrobacter sp.]